MWRWVRCRGRIAGRGVGLRRGPFLSDGSGCGDEGFGFGHVSQFRSLIVCRLYLGLDEPKMPSMFYVSCIKKIFNFIASINRICTKSLLCTFLSLIPVNHVVSNAIRSAAFQCISESSPPIRAAVGG